jgi:hypothetical protein
MRVFKTRYFARFARQESIFDEMLAKAIRDAENGLIAYAKGRRAVFLLGFAKNEQENIDPKQLADLKAAAFDILSQSDHALDARIEEGRLQEVDYDHEEDEG